MATQQSAKVLITNHSGGNAWILLFHSNSSNGMQSGSWMAAPGQTVGPLTVHFETGFGTESILDYWSVLIHVQDGPAPGFYVSSGTDVDPYWKECQLQHEDANETLTFSVDTTRFDVALRSSGCSDEMTKLAPYSPITHVFVVMLENHSFDNMFAMSGIPGITVATASNSNSYNGKTYAVRPGAPLSMPTDPAHELPDVVEQLGGQGATYPSGGPFPPVDNSGFVANYATSTSDGPLPPPQDIGDVMACFDTSAQLPVLYQLATGFAICDQWFSSVPGPTWPNRLFAYGASSSGLDFSPSNAQIVKWELPNEGFQFPNGSIFQALAKAGVPYRLYNDTTGFPRELSLYSDDPERGSASGAVSVVSTLSGVTLLDVHSLRHFAADLQGPYPYAYTFIEPHYGDMDGGTYMGGSSQHPRQDVYGGEHLLASVYAAIRNSPYWNTSLLIINYDEHGGFYDSVLPGPAPAPGDNPNYGYSKFGFNFEQLGPRVPAIIVSPRIPAGTVDHTLYDHTSILKTVEQLFGLSPLTQRDAAANGVLHLLSLTTPRTDCPASLNHPAPSPKVEKLGMAEEERAQRDAQPVPESGLLAGTLRIMMKTEIELSTQTPPEIAAIKSRFETIRTRGQAQAYIASVMEKVGMAREQRKLAARRPTRS
ncbi:MAG: alkaline phosphatase family protein [Thermoanaerobaculia bacterium]